jgi:hypothetical protein
MATVRNFKATYDKYQVVWLYTTENYEHEHISELYKD